MKRGEINEREGSENTTRQPTLRSPIFTSFCVNHQTGSDEEPNYPPFFSYSWHLCLPPPDPRNSR